MTVSSRRSRWGLSLCFFCSSKLFLPAVGFAADHAVSQKDKSFGPNTISAKVGDTITFANDDTVAHNVFAKSEGTAFNLKIQKPGEKSTVKLEKEGSFDARCAIHPKMTIKISVTK